MGLCTGASLGDSRRAARLVLGAGQRQVVEATAGSPEQGVGQYGHQQQGTGAQDGGGGRPCLNLEKQQGVDRQCWGRKWFLFSQSTNIFSRHLGRSPNGWGQESLHQGQDTDKLVPSCAPQTYHHHLHLQIRKVHPTGSQEMTEEGFFWAEDCSATV